MSVMYKESIVEYLKTILHEKEKKFLKISSQDRLGVMILMEGKVVYAIDFLGNTGDIAFYHICSWKEAVEIQEIFLQGDVKFNIENENLLSEDSFLSDNFYALMHPNVSDISFECDHPEIQKLFVKNKIMHQVEVEANQDIENIINDLILDYNIETLLVLKKEEDDLKIVTMYNCEVIDLGELLFEILDSIAKTITKKKFSFIPLQYQIKLDDGSYIFFERFKDKDYVLGVLIDSNKIAPEIVRNVFIPLMKEELDSVLD